MRLAIVTGVVLAVSSAGAAHAQEPPPPTTAPPVSIPDAPGDFEVEGGGEVGGDVTPVTLPLVPVPLGCTAPRLPHIVFVGTVADRDFRSIRFNIDRIRAGRSDPFAANNLIDVRYGLDVQYLADDQTYLVAAVVDPDLGVLVSRVTEPIKHFGGDEVIGISETDVNCPFYENPMRTLHLDGTPIEASVTKPFLDAKVRITSAVLIPLGLAIGVIFVLAMFRLSIAGLYHSLVSSRSPREVR